MNNFFSHTLLQSITFLPTILLASTLSYAQTSNATTDQEEIEEVTITASRTAIPLRNAASSVSVITQSELEQKGEIPLADILRNLPSITVANNGGLGKVSSVFIRGENSFRTLVLLDGINISDTTAPQHTPRIEHLNNSGFERIEVLRGPQGLVYGADASGVINIFSKETDEIFEGGINAELGTFDTSNLSANLLGNTGKFNYSVNISDTSSDGFNARTIDTSEDDDGYDNTTAHIKGEYDVSESVSLGAIFRKTDSDNEYDSCFSATPNDCNAEFEQDIYKVFAKLQSQHLNGELSFSKNEIHNTDTSGPENTITNDRIGSTEQIQYIGSHQYSERFTLNLGLERSTDEFENFSFGGERKRSQDSITLENLFFFESNAFLSAGLRYDDNEDFGEHTSYRAAASQIFSVSDISELKLKSSVGNGFRAPSLFEENSTDGSLTEEKSFGFDAGLEFSNKKYAFELIYFNTEITDEIIFSLDTFQYIQLDGTTRSRGFELIYNYTLDNHVNFVGNYTYTKAKTEDGLQRLRRPKELANIGIDFSFIDSRLNVLTNIRIARDSVDFGQIPLDNYAVFDLNTSFDVNRQLNIFARINNAFDEDYQEILGFNTAGRTIAAGFRFNF